MDGTPNLAYVPTSTALGDQTLAQLQMNQAAQYARKNWALWIAIAVIVIVVIIIIILMAIYIPRMDKRNVCGDPADQLQVYLQLSNVLPSEVRYAFNSSVGTVPNATVQNSGNPVLRLCAQGGTNKVPVYMYNGSQAADNTFGINATAPTGYTVANNGNPLGYVFLNNFEQKLRPIYLNTALLAPISGQPADTIKSSILSHDQTVKFTPDITYSGNFIFGYSL